MTLLPDPEHHFKFGNLMKKAVFLQKNNCFHHLSEKNINIYSFKTKTNIWKKTW